MAVNAAHLTRTVNEKPSIFEVLAQESLHSTVQPALKRVVEFISLYNSNKTGWLVKWFDEFYLVFNSVLQYKYIRYYAASFAENFYGLKRVPLKPAMFTDGFHLSEKEERISIFLLVVFPYLRQKMDQLAQKYTYDELDGVTPKDWRGQYRKLFMTFRSAFHFIYEFSSLAQLLLYVSGKSKSHSPLLKIASLSLTYAPSPLNNETTTWSDFWTNISKGNMSSVNITFEMFGTVLLRCMEIGAFFIQFVKWWEDKGPSVNMNNIPVPNFPTIDIKASQYLNTCPICLQSWKIPTVLPVSGYVFCYMCIIRHLNENHKCPVTNYYANTEDLIRLYL